MIQDVTVPNKEQKQHKLEHTSVTKKTLPRQ